MRIWGFIVDTLDTQISVDDGYFLNDLRLFAPLPAIPFFVAAAVVGVPSNTATVLVFIGIGVMIPWTIFIFRRRAIKKQGYIQPSRFSDEKNGY